MGGAGPCKVGTWQLGQDHGGEGASSSFSLGQPQDLGQDAPCPAAGQQGEKGASQGQLAPCSQPGNWQKPRQPGPGCGWLTCRCRRRLRRRAERIYRSCTLPAGRVGGESRLRRAPERAGTFLLVAPRCPGQLASQLRCPLHPVASFTHSFANAFVHSDTSVRPICPRAGHLALTEANSS